MTRPRRRTTALLTVGAAAVLVGVELLFVRGQLAAAWDALDDARPVWVLVAVAATLVSMHVFARVQRRMLHAAIPTDAPRVPIARMVGLTYSANAVNTTMPAGTAISIGYALTRMRSWGVPGVAAGFAVLASGVLSSVSFAVLLLVCAAVAGGVDVGWVLLGVLAAVTVMGLLAVRHHASFSIRSLVRGSFELVARALDRRRPSAAAAVRRTADELDAVRPRGRDWVAGGSFALLNWLADLACLVAVFHAVHGTEGTSFPLVLTAYVAGMSASSVAFLPGGLGVVEIAMIVAAHAGGVATAPATAAVLLYRLISCILVVAIGWLFVVGSAVVRRRAVAATVRLDSPAERPVVPVAVVASIPAPVAPARRQCCPATRSRRPAAMPATVSRSNASPTVRASHGRFRPWSRRRRQTRVPVGASSRHSDQVRSTVPRLEV